MSSITEQISATSKSQLESQLNFLNSVLKNTFEGAGQIVALNLSTARNAAERSTAAARQLLEAKDSRAVLDLAKPASAIESLVAYQRELFSIASQTQQAFLQTATDRLRAVPAKSLVLAVPALAQQVAQQVAQQATQIPESAVNAALAATNAASEAAQSAASGATEAAGHAAHAASDAAQAATASTVEAARTATGHVAQAAASTIQETAGATTKAAADATEATAKASGDAVEAASENIARAAATAPDATDVVSDAVKRVTDAASTSAPVAAPIAAAAESAETTQALFENEQAAPKSVRGKPATKPVAEALAALADNKPARSAPGKSRK
jgi:phasin family protein